MPTLERVKQSVGSAESDSGADSGVIPADAGVEDVCDEEVETARELLADVPTAKEGVIPALQDVQEEYGYLPRFTMELIADHTGTSMAHVYGTASFYSQFHMEPRGEHTIKVCTGTACHVKGADEVSEAFCDELDVELEGVSDDGQFTVDHVRCIGACSLAVAVMVGDEVYGDVQPDEVNRVIGEYR